MPDRTLHPIEALLLAAWLAVEAAAVLIAAMLALLLTVMSRAKKTPPAKSVFLAGGTSTPQPAPPAQHPLALLAEGLQQRPQRELMSLAGTRRRLPKHQLAAMVIACS